MIGCGGECAGRIVKRSEDKGYISHGNKSIIDLMLAATQKNAIVSINDSAHDSVYDLTDNLLTQMPTATTVF